MGGALGELAGTYHGEDTGSNNPAVQIMGQDGQERSAKTAQETMIPSPASIKDQRQN
jgi:hypothetical protein